MGLDFNLDRHIHTYMYTGKGGFGNDQALKRGNMFNQMFLSLVKLNYVFAFLYPV